MTSPGAAVTTTTATAEAATAATVTRPTAPDLTSQRVAGPLIAGALVAKEPATPAGNMVTKRTRNVVEARPHRVTSPTCPTCPPSHPAAAATSATATKNATKSATKNAKQLIDREGRVASAAGATWRTKVRALQRTTHLHRTTHVVSIHLLTDTLMKHTTRPIARTILLRQRLSGLLTGTTSTTSSSSSSKRTSGIRCVVLLRAIQHYHRTSTRRGRMLLLLCRWRRRPHQPMAQHRRR